MKIKYVIGLTLLLYSLYLLPYIWSAAQIPDGTKFEILSVKGDIGLSADYAKFSLQMQSYIDNGSALFQNDVYSPERGTFATGSLGFYAAGLPYLFSDNVMLPWLIMPLFSLFLIVLMLGRIYDNYFATTISPKRGAIISTLAILLLVITGGYGVINPFDLFQMPDATRFLGYVGRFPTIQFFIVFLVFWLYALLKYFRCPNTKTAIILAISLGILQYVYFYFFSAAYLFTAIFAILNWRFIIRNWRSVIIVVGLMVLFIAPFWYYLLTFNSSDIGIEYAVRVGKDSSMMVGNIEKSTCLYFVLFIAIDFVYLIGIKGYEWRKALIELGRSSAIIIALFVSTLALMNIQFITGFTVQSYHWVETFFFPLLAITTGFAIYRLYMLLKGKWQTYLTAVLTIGCLSIMLIRGIGGAYSASNYWKNYQYLTASEQELFNAIDNSAGKTIFSNNISAMVLSEIHTSKQSFVADAFMTLLPNDSIARYIVDGYRVCGYNEQQIMDEFRRSQWGIKNEADKKTFYDKNINIPGQIPTNIVVLPYIGHRTYYDGVDYNSSIIKPLVSKICTDSIELRPDLVVIYLRDTVAGFSQSMVDGQKIFENEDFILFNTKH